MDGLNKIQEVRKIFIIFGEKESKSVEDVVVVSVEIPIYVCILL